MEKIIALYERLSREDENLGESYSISNQKKLLEDYCKEKGWTRFRHFSDDGISGTTFERPEFKAMMQLVDDFLPMDRSGNRRFLPILCRSDEAEVHILDDEKASREYIDQMWAEAMVIYKSGDFQLKLPKKIEEELREYQKQFMQEDTKKELILDYLEHCQANMVYSRHLYVEALVNDGNPAQWEIREINDIMNNCSDWIAFSNPRHFPEPYRRQSGWEKPDNKGQDFQPITKEQMEQLSLPAEWMQ